MRERIEYDICFSRRLSTLESAAPANSTIKIGISSNSLKGALHSLGVLALSPRSHGYGSRPLDRYAAR